MVGEREKSPSKLVADEIRLITIQPSDDFKDQVRCHLGHFDISEQSYTGQFAASLRETPKVPGDSAAGQQRARSLGGDWIFLDRPNAAPATSNLPDFRYVWGDYMALSYTWGDPAVTSAILVNGIIMHVTENLEAALKALRSKSYIKAGWKIWIDALCINQKDIVERASQVKRMRDIYSRAWTPIIWLGATSAESDQAIELISKLATDYDLRDQVDTLNGILKRNPKAFGEGCWRAFHEFALRRYWSRAWILQEASVGKADMPVLCGNQTLRWIDICRAFTFLNRTDEIFNIHIDRELADVGRSLDLDIFETLGIVSEIGKYQQEMESGSKSFDLFQVMSLSRSVSATDPRDKVYGLLALMNEDLTRKIYPDYSASVEEVYIDFAKITIDVTQSLEILRHIGPAGSLSLPSWVPDWTSPHLIGSLGNTPHKASGDSTTQVSYPQPGVLSCRGFIADTFDGMGCVWQDDSGIGWPPSTVRQTVGRGNPYGGFEEAQEAIWRTMVANRDVHVQTLEEDYSSLLAVPAIVKAQRSLDNEHLQALASSHLLSYCIGFFKGNADFIIAGEKLTSYLISEPKFDQIDSSILRDALLERDRVNLRRRLFTTSKGYVGMALQDALPNDLICILFGCSMPLVLRRFDGGFRLVGECYVHGLMNGEGLEMLQRQEVAIMDFEIRE